MSSSKDKLTKKIAGNGGTAAPAQRKGSTLPTRNKYGDKLAGGFKLNTQVGNTRNGESFRTGMTDDGRVVHYYQAQPGLKPRRVVLNKKANPTFNRNI